MTKPLVIYHDSCADGFGAAFAAWLVLGDEAEYVPMQYGNIDVDLECVDRKVYILDFSFPRIMMDNIFHAAKRVVWLDHHKTAFEMWCGSYEKGNTWSYPVEGGGHRRYIRLDDNKSGAVLAWEYFHQGTEVPALIRHIDDYDRWQFKLKGTKELNKALGSYAPWSFEQWKHWLGNNPQHHISMTFAMREEGKSILRAHDQNVASVVKGSARKCMLQTRLAGMTYLADFHGLAANCPSHLTSDVGHELAKQSGTFGLLWRIDKDLKVCCSLRSIGDYDVSAIAKAFGGGGHRNAAGFQVDIQILLGWMK